MSTTIHVQNRIRGKSFKNFLMFTSDVPNFVFFSEQNVFIHDIFLYVLGETGQILFHALFIFFSPLFLYPYYNAI